MIEGAPGFEVPPAIGKRIRRHVHHAHDQGAFPQQQGTGTNVPFEDGSHSADSKPCVAFPALTPSTRCYNRPTRMYRKRAYFAVILGLLLATQLYAGSRDSVAKRIDAVLAEPDLTRGFWGIEVVALDTGQVLYSHNADKLFTPAS